MKALLRKNLWLRKKSLAGLIVELLLPVSLTCVVFLSMWGATPGLQTPVQSSTVVRFAPELKTYCSAGQGKWSDRWSPKCDAGYVKSSLVEPLVKLLREESDLEIREFPTLDAMYQIINNASSAYPNYYSSGLLLGIFESEGQVNIVGPSDLYYAEYPDYVSQAVIPSLVSRLVEKSGNVFVGNLPNYVFRTSNQNFYLEYWAGAVVMISLFLSLSSTIVSISYEKENFLVTSLLVAGVSHLQYMFSWFISQTVVSFVALTLALIPLFATGMLTSSFIQCWIVALAYLLAYISRGFVISLMFKKARFVVLWAFGYTVLSISFGIIFVIPIFLYLENEGLIYFLGILMSLLFEGVPLIGAFYVFGVSSDFSQPTPEWTDSYFPIALCFVLLVLSTFINLLLYFWLSQVQIRGCCFCCRRSRKFSRNGEAEALLNRAELEEGVRLQNLTKMFGQNAAVNDVSVEIKPKMITCLLGENGAGKSTIVRMLTGDLAPTSGSIFVDGVNFTDNINEVRKSMGICFQQDILWETLTVANHLQLFCELKGVPLDRVNETIHRMQLDGNQATKTLSGGQKRKLCLALALVGNPKFVLADEISSGIDPLFVLEIWKMLQEYQKANGSTILLTTHEMQEAETLASVVIILRKGKLKVVGTVNELAEKYNLGYKIQVSSEHEAAVVAEIVEEQGVKTHRGIYEFKVATNSIEEHLPFLRERGVKFKVVASSLREVFLEIADEAE